MMDNLLETWEPILRFSGVVAGIVLLTVLAHFVFFKTYRSLARRQPALLPLRGILLRSIQAPTRLLVPVLVLYLSIDVLAADLDASVANAFSSLLYILLVIAVAWLLIRLLHAVQEAVTLRYHLDQGDNLTARKVHTQAAILRRILSFGILVVALAAVLLHFDEFRELGTGLLASAGIAGIIVGLAAQRTLGNLFAGFQIAVSQPIRVEDVVVVEGEWGRIEEITLTYVVVRLWDLRRLVLPISYFIEKPFQNWTRTSSEIMGTVFLYVDYSVPVDAVRAELERLLNESDYWDGQVCRLHVTDNTTDGTVELRALMSASDAPTAFELRCEIREKLIAFLQREYPDALPRVRAHLDGPVAVEQVNGDDRT